MKRNILKLWLLVVLGTIGAGLSAQAPVVTSFNPTNGASGVAVNQVLSVTFDKNIQFGLGTIRIRTHPLNPIFQSFIIDAEEGEISSFLSISGQTLYITHNNLANGIQYYVTISNGAILSLANPDDLFAGFTNNSTWNFTTVPAVSPPSITSRSPAPGATEVLRNSPTLTVTFNESIDLSINENLRLRVKLKSNDQTVASFEPGQLGVSRSGAVLTIATNNTFAYGTEYYVTMDAGFVKSAASGVDFPGFSSSNYWTFTTETSPPLWASTYPTISSQNSTGFTFKGQADQEGIMYFVVTSTSGPAPTADQVRLGQNGSGVNAHIAINEAMAANVELSRLVAFNANTSLGANYYLYAVAYSGNKPSEVRRIDIDRTAPAIMPGLTNPINGYMLFPTDSEIILVFSEAVYGFVGPGNEPINSSYFSLKTGGADLLFNFAVSSDGTTITLNPLTDLLENTEYTITINAIADAFGNSSGEIITRNFQTDKINRWIGGGVNTNWSDPANWVGTYVATKSVLIPVSASYPSVTSGVISVHNLVVEPGALLTHTGGTINATGIFNLQSSPAVNASYINNGGGQLNIDPTRIRIDQVVSVSNETYIISSPISGATKAGIGATNRMFWYNNTTDSYVEFLSGTMEVGRGYLARSANNLVFSGPINTSNVTANLTFTDGKGFGWNMIGNPYAAAVNWELLGKTESVENSVWIWQHLLGVYGTYSSESGVSVNITDSWIPSNHGFLVKVKQGYSIGSVTFEPSDMGKNTTSYLKSGSNLKTNALPHIKLAGVYGTSRDETAVVITPDAISGTDKFDAQKYFSNSTKVLEVYTLSGTLSTAINGLPYVENMEIPLGYSAPLAGAYSIEMVTNSIDGMEVLLVDKTEGVTTNISSGGSYAFNVTTAGKNQTRFVLKLKQQATTNTQLPVDELTSVKVFSKEREILVQSPVSENKFEFTLYDLSGRKMQTGMLVNGTTLTIPVSISGTYIVMIKNASSGKLEQHKVVVF